MSNFPTHPLLSLPLSFPSFPLPFASPSRLPSLFPFPRRPHPENQLGILGERCKLPSGVWGKAAADKRFDAYLGQKEQLWWEHFCVWNFVRINQIFCTNTRLQILYFGAFYRDKCKKLQFIHKLTASDTSKTAKITKR